MPSFLSYVLQLITVLLLICDSYMSWSTKFVSLELCVGVSIFNSSLFLLVYIFARQNAWVLWLQNVIIPFKIKTIEKPHSFAPSPLIFQLQQEVLKFNNICVSWRSPKTDLVINFLNLKVVSVTFLLVCLV